MPWVRSGDGLRYEGEPHYDLALVRRLIGDLRQARNRPESICAQLDHLLVTGEASKSMLWQLSKWCHWNDESARTAQKIARNLFYGNVPRRLRDQENRPIPDSATAEREYEDWLERVAAAGTSPSRGVLRY